MSAKTRQGSPGPKYAVSWARSTAFGVKKYFEAVKKPYATQVDKVSSVFEKITSESKMKEFVKTRLSEYMEKDKKAVQDQLDKPPSKDKPVFKVEDMEDDSANESSRTTPTPTPTPTLNLEPSQSCIGPEVHKHVTRDTLANNIKDFCAQAVKQGVQDRDSGSLGREFNFRTPEHVAIVMTWPSGSTFKPSESDCNHYLADMLMDGCSGNDPENPMNWKRGGKLQVGDVEYRIEPLAPRHPAPKEPWAGCDTTYKVVLDKFWIWGRGFANSDFGKKLHEEVSGCGRISKWTFDYGTGNDGREWTATGQLPIFTEECLERAVDSAGGPALECDD